MNTLSYPLTCLKPSCYNKMVQSSKVIKWSAQPKNRKIYTFKFDRKRIIKYLQEEFATSTTHGLPYVVNQKIHWFERCFWAVCFALSIVFVFYLVGVQFARFMETPIVMSVEMDYFNWNISYPAITLCPAIKYDEQLFHALVNETNARTGKNLELFIRTIVSVNIENFDILYLDTTPDILASIDPREYTGIAAAVIRPFDNTSITANKEWPITVEEVMTEFGMCHVINSNIAAFSNPNKWNDQDLTYEESNIELSLYDQGFFTQVKDYAEIYKVFIHSPDETILCTSPSFTHSLKGYVSFGVTVWSTKISEELTGFPIQLRKCRFSNEPISKRYSIYSYNHCMQECRIQMILKLCGCVPHFYKPLENEKVCSLTDLSCVVEYKKDIVTLSTSEDTLSKFPNLRGLPRNSHDCHCVGKCENDVYQKDYENFVPQNIMNRVKIGMASFPKVRVVRALIFSSYDAVLKIGGVINLCTGASILSLMELCVTFLRMPVYGLVRKLKDKIKHIC